jgi:hypothetical protein
MTEVTVDNTVVTVLLGNNETFTPSTGSVQDVTISVAVNAELEIDNGTQSQRIVDGNANNGEDNTNSISAVIDDSITLKSISTSNSGEGIYISGFEVN